MFPFFLINLSHNYVQHRQNHERRAGREVTGEDVNKDQTASAQPALSALDEWVRDYGADVINLAYAYLRNYHLAQDVSQDVFLRAYTRYESFRGDSSVKTWLLSITANRCKDYLRSWATRHEVMEEGILDYEASEFSTEREVEERLQRDSLWATVHSLPVKYREVLILYYQRGLSGQEIAQILDTSEQNVRTRLHRGRQLLKERVEEGGLWDDTNG